MDDFNFEDFEQYLIQGEPDKKTLKKHEQKVAINDMITGDKVAIKQKSSDIILEYLKNNDSINSSIAQNITGLLLRE